MEKQISDNNKANSTKYNTIDLKTDTNKNLEPLEIIKWALRNKLIYKLDNIVIGLSGGIDSMVLLDILTKVKDKLGLKIYAAHFNHHIRGEESDRDENFVKQYCLERKVEFISKSGEVLDYAKEKHMSVEEAARELRYGFLNSFATEHNAKIATAHHANDNLETIIMNIIRGTSTGGLSGIPIRNKRIIRPIMCMTRDEISEYAKINGLPHVEDSTNKSDGYLRNRVRHNIIPLLVKENKNVIHNMIKTADDVREDSELLNATAEKIVRNATIDKSKHIYSAEKLKKTAKPILKRALFQIVSSVGPEPTSASIESLMKLFSFDGEHDGRKFTVQITGVTAIRTKDNIEFMSNKDINNIKNENAQKDKLENSLFAIQLSYMENITKISKDKKCMMVNADTVKGEFRIRKLQDGDKITTENGERTVSRLMRSRGIKEYDRKNYPVIVDDSGIVAIPNVEVAYDRRVKIGDNAFIFKIQLK